MKVKKFLPALFIFAGSAQATTTDFLCTPTNVGQVDSRIHIQCEQASIDGSNSIIFFAVPTTGTSEAPDISNRFLAVGMAALASGKRVRMVYINGDTSGGTYGCGGTNCRKAIGFFLER